MVCLCSSLNIQPSRPMKLAMSKQLAGNCMQLSCTLYRSKIQPGLTYNLLLTLLPPCRYQEWIQNTGGGSREYSHCGCEYWVSNNAPSMATCAGADPGGDLRGWSPPILKKLPICIAVLSFNLVTYASACRLTDLRDARQQPGLSLRV